MPFGEWNGPFLFSLITKVTSVLKVDTGLTVKIFGQFFGRFILVIELCVGLQRGKCGCLVLIKKLFFEVNPPYGQSDFTVNPGR